MGRQALQQVAAGDFALGLKTATFIVVLGLMAAVVDRSMVTPAAEPAVAQPVSVAAPAPEPGARIEVPFAVNDGDVEAPPATF